MKKIMIALCAMITCLAMTACSASTSHPTTGPVIETTVVTEPISDNPLIAAGIVGRSVMNGSGTKVIGEYGMVYVDKAVLQEITMEQYAEFCETVLDPMKYNWVSIKCEDWTGIQFPGAMAEMATYGEIDYDGSITTVIGYINPTEDGYVYEQDASQEKTVTLGNLSFTVTNEMNVVEAGENAMVVEVVPEKSLVAMCCVDIAGLDVTLVDPFLDGLRSSLVEGMAIGGETPFSVELVGYTASGISYGELKENGDVWGGVVFAFADSQYAYAFRTAAHPDDIKGYSTDAGMFLASATYTAQAETATATETVESNAVAEPAQETVAETTVAETTPIETVAETYAPDPEPEEEMVWIPTGGGKKYHNYSSCSNMDNPSHVTISRAKAMGFTPCKRCH